MLTEIEKLLNCREHLKENIHVFIEAFVKFYGEEHRKEIEDKFSNAMLIGYYSPESLKLLLFSLTKEKSKELKRKIVQAGDNILSEDDLFGYNDFSNKELMPVYKLKEFYNYFKMGPEGRKKKFIEEAILTIKKNIPSFTKEDYFQIIEEGKIPEKFGIIPKWMIDNINYYSNLNNAEKKYAKLYSEVKELINKINPNITLQNINEYENDNNFKKLLNIIDKLDKFEDEYNEYISRFDKYQQETNENYELNHNISKKYYREYILNNIDLVPEEKRKEVYDYLEKSEEGYAYSDFVNNFFSYSIKGNSLIESFSEESSEILIDGKDKWRIQKIKENILKYFKIMGISNAESFEECIVDSNVQNNWPRRDRVEKFVKDKEKLINRFNIEYYSSINMYKEMREEISKLDLIDKEDGFSVRLYAENSTFVSPNIVEKEGKYSLFPLIGICCNSQNDYLDHRIVHELNHLFELDLVKATDKEYQYTCGWEEMIAPVSNGIDEIDTINLERENREYELFNEIINELIAEEISEIMRKENLHVFNSASRAKIKGGTSYEQTFFLVNDFFNEYKNTIIESRRNRNINMILDEVGEENFDELNSLFEIYNENFSGLRIYNLYSSLKDGIDNEQTRIYKELQIKRDIILEKMRNYKQNNMTQKNVLQ